MKFLTLSQINSLVGGTMKNAFPATYWVLAETSDVRPNKNGHCYLEFVERDKNNTIIARARGYIWSNIFQELQPHFEQESGQAFVSGLNVLVNVAVDFHPVYGYGLCVYNIDPAYTAGDLQRHRRVILDRLEKEGILQLNQELEIPLLPQRVAVITSPTAAGYEDFINHLTHNSGGLVFYPHLFPAVMQGEQTGKSIIVALNAIYTHCDRFDVVVIIRGGGATSDLAAFDDYDLAANCAQFPLPIITGIGHERDDTVLDFVAHYRARTPTAAADYIVECLEETATDLSACQSGILYIFEKRLEVAAEQLRQIVRYLPASVQRRIENRRLTLNALQTNLFRLQKQRIFTEEMKLREKEAFFKLSSPAYILSKGYSITLKDGKVVKSVTALQADDTIETVLKDGKVKSTVSIPTAI